MFFDVGFTVESVNYSNCLNNNFLFLPFLINLDISKFKMKIEYDPETQF